MRIYPPRTSIRQKSVLDFVAVHQGCSAADVTREEGYGGGVQRRGHAASYARVTRLKRRGFLKEGPSTGRGIGLWLGAFLALFLVLPAGCSVVPGEVASFPASVTGEKTCCCGFSYDGWYCHCAAYPLSCQKDCGKKCAECSKCER